MAFESILRYGAIAPPVLRLSIALIVLSLTLLCVKQDYHAFQSLGPGGVPSTFGGYARVKFLGFFAIKDRCKPLSVPIESRGYLTDLPTRKRERPEIRGIVPHRQITQKASIEVYAKLSEALGRIADSNDTIVIGTSCFEKQSSALFSTSPVKRTCKGEVCHSHRFDGSMHLTLHPNDSKIAIEAGWSEWHPLACGVLGERCVPAGFVMVYAPLNKEEIEVVLRIVRAAAWYVGGTLVAEI